VDRAPMLRIFGDEIPLRARVEVLNGYSAHADRKELHKWIDAVRGSGKAPPVHLVHGEIPAQDTLAADLRAKGYTVRTPVPGDHADF
jgi:metallo-beta-lactamase family protein